MIKQVPIFKGQVKNGVLKLATRPQFEEWVKGLDGEVELVVAKPRRPRSDQENKYYWACIVKMISDQYGDWPDDVHQGLKERFLRDGGSDSFPHFKSTTELSTVEAEDYYSKCRMWAASELNIQIPLPNEVLL